MARLKYTNSRDGGGISTICRFSLLSHVVEDGEALPVRVLDVSEDGCPILSQRVIHFYAGSN